MDLGLTDKVVIITGGAQGIGAAVADTCRVEGAKVAILDRNEVQSSERTLGITLDLNDDGAVRTAISKVLATFGRIDAVVNNAGRNDGIDISHEPMNFIDSLNQNIRHYYSVVHFCHEELVRRSGSIVNISSKVSLTGQGGTSGYAAAKGAINALTREWAVDFAGKGVRVNAVLPAEVWTPMYDQWLQTQNDISKTSIAERVPLDQRFTTAEEIASTVVFLVSERSSHTTGQILVVDGGYVHLDRKIT